MPCPWEIEDTFLSEGVLYQVSAVGPDWCRCISVLQKDHRAIIFDYAFPRRLAQVQVEGLAREYTGYWWHDVPSGTQQDITRIDDQRRARWARITVGSGQTFQRGMMVTAGNGGDYRVVEVHEGGVVYVETVPEIPMAQSPVDRARKEETLNAAAAARERVRRNALPIETRFERLLKDDDA